MWLAWGLPTGVTVTLVGTGASIISPSSAANLYSGRAGIPTRIQWLSNPTPAITDVLKIQLTWTDPAFVPGFFGVFGFRPFGMANPGGFQINVLGQTSVGGAFNLNLGGNSQSQRTVKCGDNSTKHLVLPASALTPITGVEFDIYNNQLVAGVPTATLTPGQMVDFGSLWASLGADFDIDANWKLTIPPNNADIQRSINSQPWPAPYPAARTLFVTMSDQTFAQTYIDGALPCLQTLRTLIGNGQPSVQIPRWVSAINTLNPDFNSVHATAILGISTFTEIAHDAGDIFSTAWNHAEIPSLGV